MVCVAARHRVFGLRSQSGQPSAWYALHGSGGEGGGDGGEGGGGGAGQSWLEQMGRARIHVVSVESALELKYTLASVSPRKMKQP